MSSERQVCGRHLGKLVLKMAITKGQVIMQSACYQAHGYPEKPPSSSNYYKKPHSKKYQGYSSSYPKKDHGSQKSYQQARANNTTSEDGQYWRDSDQGETDYGSNDDHM